MAQRQNRYRQLEKLMTIVLIADGASFGLYLLFAALNIVFLKIVFAVAAIGISALSIVILVLNQEYKRRRSLWMTASAAAILLCMLVSLISGFPGP